MPLDLRKALQERLAELTAEADGIRTLLASYGQSVVSAAPVARKRAGMSAAARKRLSLAAKKRWAAARKAGKSKL